jgi:hypothetical protein
MLSEYNTNGFYTERGFFSERYMDELRDEVDSITQTKGLLFLNEIQIHKESPIIKEIIFDGVLRGMINKFIGNHFPIQSQLRFKPPSSDGFSYHQDDYWTQAGFGNTINVLVHIDEATVDNGCIYVLPKSHKPPFHEDRVYLIAKPGDITFLHNYVIHGSDNNDSNEFRRNLLLMYVKEDCEFEKGEGAEREVITNG